VKFCETLYICPAARSYFRTYFRFLFRFLTDCPKFSAQMTYVTRLFS